MTDRRPMIAPGDGEDGAPRAPEEASGCPEGLSNLAGLTSAVACICVILTLAFVTASSSTPTDPDELADEAARKSAPPTAPPPSSGDGSFELMAFFLLVLSAVFCGLFVWVRATTPRARAAIPSSPANRLGLTVFGNFCFMSLCFSLNHASVVACLALSTADLGPKLGNISNGCLYGAYTLSALLIAAPVVKWLKPKKTLVMATHLFCVYVGSFYIDEILPSLKEPATIIGGVVGGVAAGLLFTAQGSYFTTTAQRYTDEQVAKGEAEYKLEHATSMLAGTFAFIYLACEVLFKVMASILEDEPRLITNCVLAVGSSLCMLLIRELEPLEVADVEGPEPPFFHKICAAAELFYRDKKMVLVCGINISFGLASAYLTSYLNGTVVKKVHGKAMIGYFSAITPVVAMLLALPLSHAAKTSKTPVMIMGSLAFVVMLTIPLSVDFETISKTHVLWFVYMLEGTGRAVFEGNAKAVYADFFEKDKEAAFANGVVQSGGAATLAFFFLAAHRGHAAPSAALGGNATGSWDGAGAPPVDPRHGGDGGFNHGVARVGLLFALYSIVGYLLATRIHEREKLFEASKYVDTEAPRPDKGAVTGLGSDGAETTVNPAQPD